MPLVSTLPSVASLGLLWRRSLRILVVLLAVGASILLAAWLTLQWGILPRIERWRPQIETWATRAVGAPVRIAAIEVTGSLWAPMLTLDQVRISDPQGREALKLDRVRAVLVPRSLLPTSLTRWEPRFEQLVIDAPMLDVRRDRQGRLWVAGLAVGSAEGDGHQVADWLFSQREVALRQGQLRWTDETRAAPPLQLTQVDLVLRNTLTRHRLRLDATPPPEWGERFSLQGDLRQSLLVAAGLQHIGDWRRWRGQLYASAPLVDVQALHRHVDLPVDLHEGRAAVQAWLQLDQGLLTGASLNLALQEVSVTLGEGLEPLALKSLSAHIDAQRQHEGLLGRVEAAQLNIRRLVFETGDGIQWPQADLTLSLQRNPDGAVRNGSVEATRVELAVLADLATRVPLAGPVRQLIEQAAPKGRLDGWKLRWQGPLETPTSWWTAGQAQAVNLAGAPAPPHTDTHTLPGRPGVHQAAIGFEFTERGGSATLQVKNGALEFPGVFDDPLVPMAQLSAELRWRVDRVAGQQPSISVDVSRASFANADAVGQLDARWHTGPGNSMARGAYLPGVLDLNVRLNRADATRVHRYLPLGLPESTRHYVRDAVRGGRASSVIARVKGDLWDFPFTRAGSGEFLVRAQVQDAEFAYVPEPAGAWPAFTQAQAELVFDRQSLHIRKGQARVGSVGSGGFVLSQVEGDIADFGHEPTLRIEGRGKGLLADALAYVKNSPVGGFIGHALDSATANGSTELTLGLAIPLAHAEHTEVQGSVLLGGNTVQFRPDVPTLADARAQVAFSHQGFSVKAGSARALGGTLTFEGGQQADGAIRFTGQGNASAEGLRRASEMPALATLGAQLTGQASYRLQLGFLSGGRSELTLTSNLVGLGTRLPAPFAKPEAEAWPFKLSLLPQPGGESTARRELLRVELATPTQASLIDAHYLREAPATDNGSPRVLRGALGLGSATTLLGANEPGGTVTATVVLPQLSLDSWLAWQDRQPPEAGASNGGTAASPDRDSEAYLPTRASLRVGSLALQGQRLANVVAQLSHGPASDGPRAAQDWQVDITSDQLAGRIDWRDAGGNKSSRMDNSRLKARLTRLWLAKDELGTSASVPGPAGSGEPLDRLPSLDLQIEDLVWHGKPLGKLELQAQNRVPDEARSAPREWRINKLALSLPEAQFSATGNWAAPSGGAARRTALSFQLDIQNSGQLLDRFGFAGTVRNGNGQFKGQVAWQGSPLGIHWPSLSGNLQIGLDKGRFLRAEPGVARLLGVLSLQSLPRRLLFDFSDVFNEGFSFDRMEGDATLTRGVASTRNLRIRGLQATILTEGSTDLLRETQDLHVWVVPEFNAGAASLAYAAINPAIGLGTLLGQLFLSKPLAEAATREFHVTGRWDAPQVDPVGSAQSKPTPEPLPQPQPPAGSASAP